MIFVTFSLHAFIWEYSLTNLKFDKQLMFNKDIQTRQQHLENCLKKSNRTFGYKQTQNTSVRKKYIDYFE